MQTAIDRAELEEAFALAQLDSMSGRDLETFFLEIMVERLESFSDEELIQEIKESHPELLARIAG
jgi:hypothetical protein